MPLYVALPHSSSAQVPRAIRLDIFRSEGPLVWTYPNRTSDTDVNLALKGKKIARHGMLFYPVKWRTRRWNPMDPITSQWGPSGSVGVRQVKDPAQLELHFFAPMTIKINWIQNADVWRAQLHPDWTYRGVGRVKRTMFLFLVRLRSHLRRGFRDKRKPQPTPLTYTGVQTHVSGDSMLYFYIMQLSGPSSATRNPKSFMGF